MNRPQISIPGSIKIVISDLSLEHDDPYCVSAIYEDGFISLVIFTLFMQYMVYVDACTGEICGLMTEPVDFVENEKACECSGF